MTTNPRIVGIDSLSPVSLSILESATHEMGQMPAFWGRYFTSANTKGSGEYHHRIENPILSGTGIRILPIARQTNDVHDTQEHGFRDGLANALDIIATFGAEYLIEMGGRISIMLDVEGSQMSHLSVGYYTGWCNGLKRVPEEIEFIPCVYGIPGDTITWLSLQKALLIRENTNVMCGGVWLSHPYSINSRKEPIEWNSKMLIPYQQLDIPVLLWQYMFGDNNHLLFDRSIVNPNLADASEFLSTLILPP
jgi:hypothetical protein